MQGQTFGIHPYGNVRGGGVSYSFEPTLGPRLVLSYSASIQVKVGIFSKTKQASGGYSVETAMLKSNPYATVGYSSAVGPLSLKVTAVDAVKKTAAVDLALTLNGVTGTGKVVISLAGEWISFVPMADGFYARTALHVSGLDLNIVLESKKSMARLLLRRVGLS